MEAGEYGLTRRTFRRAPSRGGRRRRAAVDFVVQRFFRVFLFNFFFLRTHTACRKHEAHLPHLPLY